jgi:hypothetical protein
MHDDLIIRTRRDADIEVKAKGDRATIEEASEVGASSRHAN